MSGTFVIMRGHDQMMKSVCIMVASWVAMVEQKSRSAQAPELPGRSHQTAPPIAR